MEKKLSIENTDVSNEFGIVQQLFEENENLKQTVADLDKRLIEIESHQQQGIEYPEQSEEIDGTRIFERIKCVEEASRINTESIGDLDLKFQLHENSVIDGYLIWKINNFQQRSSDAIIGKTRALHSAPCFTSKYGYKFCLRLYLHGDGMGKGTHLSLFLVLMKSEYDNILEWPFQKKIKFTLINQEDRSKDHVEKMFPNKDSSSFQKPKKDMNIASGCPMFMNLNRLQPEGFLKDDSLFVEVKID